LFKFSRFQFHGNKLEIKKLTNVDNVTITSTPHPGKLPLPQPNGQKLLKQAVGWGRGTGGWGQEKD
jgi:hypothetical protein